MLKQFGTILKETLNNLGLSREEALDKLAISDKILELYLTNKEIPNDLGLEMSKQLGVKPFYSKDELKWETGLPNEKYRDGKHKFLVEIPLCKRSKIVKYAYIDSQGWFTLVYSDIDNIYSKNYIELKDEKKWIILDK